MNVNSTAWANSMFVIVPYVDRGTWMFDDPAVGLVGEPYVADIPEMIDLLVEGIPEAVRDTACCFPYSPFVVIRLRSCRSGPNSVERGIDGWNRTARDGCAPPY